MAYAAWWWEYRHSLDPIHWLVPIVVIAVCFAFERRKRRVSRTAGLSLGYAMGFFVILYLFVTHNHA